MKYYLLTNTINLKEIGFYPQCNSPKSIGNLRELDYSKPIENLVSPKLILNPKAKQTDYIVDSYINQRRLLIIRNDFFEFLKKFNIEKYQYWNIEIHYTTKSLNNYFLFFMHGANQAGCIDFLSSRFSIKKIKDLHGVGMNVSIKDYDNFLNTIDVLPEQTTIVCDKLIINFNRIEYELFKLPRIPFIGGYIVSEKLKNAIEEKKYTGMDFKEISKLDKRIEIIY